MRAILFGAVMGKGTLGAEKAEGTLEKELENAYCNRCASPELKITRIIKIECRKCGRKRLITSRLDESKR